MSGATCQTCVAVIRHRAKNRHVAPGVPGLLARFPVVQPLSVNRTRVSFLRYVWDHATSGSSVSADAAVEQVEREDEAVVEAVQQGMRSHFYTRGRYSPTHEQGTHHFHRLLAAFLNGAATAPSGRAERDHV